MTYHGDIKEKASSDLLREPFSMEEKKEASGAAERGIEQTKAQFASDLSTSLY